MACKPYQQFPLQPTSEKLWTTSEVHRSKNYPSALISQIPESAVLGVVMTFSMLSSELS